MRERGLKFLTAMAHNTLTVSLSLRERGLKFTIKLPPVFPKEVALLARAWIEIFVRVRSEI